MGKRFAILIGAAALGAALMAVGASANFRSVDDPRGDTRCGYTPPCSDRETHAADIVRATAGHEGGRLRHTIRVVGKFQGATLDISTDLDPSCEWFLEIERGLRSGAVRPGCHNYGDPPIGRARYDFHRHSVEIFFSERSIGNPQSYGWFVFTEVGGELGRAQDRVPNKHHYRYIRHRLAQTAAAAVDSVPPDLKLSGPKKQNPQKDKFCDRWFCDVIVHMSCGHEACTTRAKGKLTNVKNDRLNSDGPIVIRPGKTIGGTGPEMTRKKQRKQVRKALDEGKRVKAKVTVRAKDAAGNVATAKRTIRIVKRVRHH